MSKLKSSTSSKSKHSRKKSVLRKVKTTPKLKLKQTPLGKLKTFTYEERLTMFSTVTESLITTTSGDKLCVSNKALGNAIEMQKRFGSPSAAGEAWIGYTFKNGYKVAVKKMPLGIHDQHESYTT